MYHLIIFDMDGLMYDTERVMARAYLETTKEWGVRSQLADFMTLVGSDGKAICRRYHEMFGADFDAEESRRSSPGKDCRSKKACACWWMPHTKKEFPWQSPADRMRMS